MATNFVQKGDVIALKHCLGIVQDDCVSGDIVAVAIEGVWEVPKVSAAVFVVGEKLIYDSSAGEFDDSSATPASGDITGGCIAVKAGANAETTATVKLTPGNATLNA